MGMMKLIFFTMVLVGLSHGYERGPNGQLRVSSWGCRLKYLRPCPVVSLDYPNPAAHDLAQTGRFAADRKTNERMAMKLSCDVFSLPQNPDGSCGSEYLRVEDVTAREVQTICGDRPGLSVVTESLDVYIAFYTGPQGGGKMNCSMDLIYLSDSGDEQAVTEPPYYTHEYVEEDSSEHGGEPGEIGTTCPCGTANKMSSRIVNGTVTLPNEYPFIVAIVQRSSLSQFCGGAIISERHVLTAAHCTIFFLKRGPSFFAVMAGAHNLGSSTDTGNRQVIGVKKIINHEQYDLGKNHNDIAMLILEESFKFNPFVTRVCLPTPDMDFVNKNLKVIGWGSQYLGGSGSNLLRSVNIRGYAIKSCSFSYSDLLDSQLCTYRTSKSSCLGDSGGPVVWVDPETNRYTLAGLVSFGRVCGDDSPTIHSKVPAYLDWISEKIRDNDPSQVCTKA